MTRVKLHACLTCGVQHFADKDDCERCRQAKYIKAHMCECALCGDVFLPRGPGRYCSSTCSHAVGEARKSVAIALAKHMKKTGMPPASEFKCVDCGKQADAYDHREYLKPLAVDPVCYSHNSRRGPATDVRELVAAYMGIHVSELPAAMDRMATAFHEWRNALFGPGRVRAPCPSYAP